MSSSKMIVLKSSDGKTFEVEELVALESQTIRHMIEDDSSGNGVIFLPNVTSKILSKVIDYCNHHVEAAKSSSSSSSSSSVEGGDSKSSSSSDDEDHKTFDAEFVKVDYGVLFDLFRAANYLNIKSLHDLTGQTVGGMMKGKTPDEIRKMFNIKNHCTPAETMVDEKFVRENAWAFY